MNMGVVNSAQQMFNSRSYVNSDFNPLPLKLSTSQIADEDRRISVLYDMLDHQDATNRDAKGLPFTVREI